jgi:hypothetical protein
MIIRIGILVAGPTRLHCLAGKHGLELRWVSQAAARDLRCLAAGEEWLSDGHATERQYLLITKWSIPIYGKNVVVRPVT